jgi:NAD(P)-dependent dehydrogenase (short-subunit alcohol dehydrogenase family)
MSNRAAERAASLGVLVTGGTSGLGRALALLALSQGHRVAVVGRDPLKLERIRAEAPALHALRADLGRKEDIHPLAAQAVAALGQVDVLVNGASELGPVPLRLLLDTQCEDFERVLQANLLGPFRLARLLLPGMVLRGRGLVVNVSSDASENAYPRWGAYGVSKAALDHLTRTWAAEEPGVGFWAVDPGEMDTPMHAAAIPDADRSQLRAPGVSAERIWAGIERRLRDGAGGLPVREAV